MPRRLPRAEQQARTRQAVLDAATTLFAARGFHATGIEDIAQRAGMSRGAIYSNFTSKQDLLLAVMGRASTVMDDPVFADSTLPFPRRLRAYADHLVDNWKTVRPVI